MAHLEKRVKIKVNSSFPPDMAYAILTDDPFPQSGQYGLGWVYFCCILLIITGLVRMYHFWGDRVRRAIYKEELAKSATIAFSPQQENELNSAQTDSTTQYFFPANKSLPMSEKRPETLEIDSPTSWGPLNNCIALFRWVFYRPLPVLKIGRLHCVFPSLGVVFVVGIALIFSVLYCFVPQPFYYPSMSYGSPPLAIRAGMISVGLMPWIIALSSKANFITVVTGISHERLNVLHRWAGYLCLLFALIHSIPYIVQSNSDPAGFQIFKIYMNQPWWVYTTGVAAIVPLLILSIHSLPILRAKAYELFVVVHLPMSIIFIGMMFWHCGNALTSWGYLIASATLLLASGLFRLIYLNWANPFNLAWLIGEESCITILPENAIKITIPTQKNWRPGQYVYLRMPGISFTQNHPFTIASLCSDDFPSQYGDSYRDMHLVFRPFGGFTRRVYNTAMEKGPWQTYRAFIDGPYGGMTREISSFDQVIFIAGGSGITAIASQLLDLIKKMRDGKAITRQVRVIWALKRPDTMEWFKEELRICREFAPLDSVHCSFFITASKRFEREVPPSNSRPHSWLNDKVNGVLNDVASKRSSRIIMPDVTPHASDSDGEAMKREGEDEITALPQVHLAPPAQGHGGAKTRASVMSTQSAGTQDSNGFDFGFPNTPTKFQKSLMRFAFLPTNHRDGWRTEYGRPDIPYLLKEMAKNFGKRTCVYVCGPPSLRVDVASTVAKLQHEVWSDPNKDEIYLHAENYAI